MNRFNLKDFKGGWIIGNFQPSLFRTDEFELCVKYFHQGQNETLHYQKTAYELTLVISGTCRLADNTLTAGQGIVIDPLVEADFEAVTDCTILGVKWPSKPGDKVIV